MARFRNKGRRANWTPEMMDDALKLLKDGKSQRYVEQKTGIPRRTLRNHMKTNSRKRKLGCRTVLTPEQENDLVSRIMRLADLGVPLNSLALRRNVYKYVVNQNIKHPFNPHTELAGKEWYAGFMRRHPDIRCRKAQSMNCARAQKLNPVIVNDYFTKLESTLDKLGMKNKPECIFNVDEKGCRLCLHHAQTVLARKGTKRVHLIANEHGENVTVTACISAAGYAIPPMIIYKGKVKKPEYVDNLPSTSLVEMSDKGSMTAKLFCKFLHHLNRYKPAGPILLLLDGAKCHVDITVVEVADKLGIHLFCLPSNTTHELQPCDVAVFRSYEHFWDQELLKYWDRFPDRSLNKARFGFIFTPVWQKTMIPANIESGFKKTG